MQRTVPLRFVVVADRHAERAPANVSLRYALFGTLLSVCRCEYSDEVVDALRRAAERQVAGATC